LLFAQCPVVVGFAKFFIFRKDFLDEFEFRRRGAVSLFVEEQPYRIAFTDLIWSDGDLFSDEWMDFSQPQKENDFWNTVLEDDLLVSLK